MSRRLVAHASRVLGTAASVVDAHGRRRASRLGPHPTGQLGQYAARGRGPSLPPGHGGSAPVSASCSPASRDAALASEDDHPRVGGRGARLPRLPPRRARAVLRLEQCRPQLERVVPRIDAHSPPPPGASRGGGRSPEQEERRARRRGRRGRVWCPLSPAPSPVHELPDVFSQPRAAAADREATRDATRLLGLWPRRRIPRLGERHALSRSENDHGEALGG